jgi:hypothetical protein
MRPWSSTGQNFWQLVANYTSRRKYQLSTRVLAGLDPAIGYPQPIANDAIPISNHPMKMTGSSPMCANIAQFLGHRGCQAIEARVNVNNAKGRK